MLVAVMRFDLRIPGAHSLKQKRHVLKSLIAALRSKFNVSVAEVDHQDLWQRTTLAVASTAAEGHHVRVVMQRVERFVEAWGEVEVIGADLTLHDPED
jgi:uncharacterized protein YlxP (DUF503 family)